MAKTKAKPKQTGGAKRKSPKKTTRSTGSAAKIARIDTQLVRLLQQRADAVLDSTRRSGKAESSPLTPFFDEESVRLLAGKSRGPMSAESIVSVMREAADSCRPLIRRPRVVFAGPRLGIAHLAAMRHFGGTAECLPIDGVAAVFEEIGRGQSDFGLIRLGASAYGRSASYFDMLVKSGMRMCGKVVLGVHYAVLGKCSRDEVREVYGEPAVLPWCRGWIATHLPTARIVEVAGTSTACRLAVEKLGGAAVAVRQWAVACKLDVLADKIESQPAGTACFAVIGENIPARTKHDSTAILFQVDNRVGALNDALAVLKRNKVNIKLIESLSAETSEKSATFYLELDGHEADKRLCRKLDSLRRKTTRMEILGSFPTPGTIE